MNLASYLIMTAKRGKIKCLYFTPNQNKSHKRKGKGVINDSNQ